jgi:hypothetical protein
LNIVIETNEAFRASSPMRKMDLAHKVDPITFEVIRHRLQSITDEQAIALKSDSGSPIVT